MGLGWFKHITFINLWVMKIPWRRKWQPTPVFLPGKSHGQRNLVCYSPWGRKESDTTERLHSLLLLWHEVRLRSSGVRSRRLGTPRWSHPGRGLLFQHFPHLRSIPWGHNPWQTAKEVLVHEGNWRSWRKKKHVPLTRSYGLKTQEPSEPSHYKAGWVGSCPLFALEITRMLSLAVLSISSKADLRDPPPEKT